MPEPVITAASIIRYCTELESRLSAYYDDIAQRFPAYGELYAGLARDCEKISSQVTRTYRETVSDALETGFAFKGLCVDQHAFDDCSRSEMTSDDARRLAISLETNAETFYGDAAECAASLLATIPRVFRRASRSHAHHIELLGE